MDSIAATSVLRPQPTRIAPALEEERTAPATVAAAAAGGGAPSQANPKFSDVVAILNPLQNLPIVGTIYRKLTDDVPHPAARAVGGLLWGGPLGLVGAIFTYVAEQVSGKSTTEIVKSIFDGDGSNAALAEQPAAGTEAAGSPRRLLPPEERAAAPAATGSPALAEARPGPSPVPQPTQAPMPPAGTASELRPRNPAVRDVAFYQAHAGARLPPASTAVGPTGGPQAPTQLPAFQRAIGPTLGSEPLGTPAPAQAQAQAAGAPPLSPQDFMQRMKRGLDQYQALNRSMETQPRAATLDRVE